jgi:hypothetical protein
VAKNKKRKKKKRKPPTTSLAPLPAPTCSTGILVNSSCCTPTTCAAEGKTCGTIADGCGGTVECGSCISPQTCGGGNPGTPGVCGCTKATCAAGQCGQPAEGCGGTLDCVPAVESNSCWALAGSADPFGPDARIRVDDDLSVFVNGQVVAQDDDGRFSEVGPFIFSAQPGDQLRVVATDGQAGWRELGALYLWSAGGGGARNLSSGVPRTASPQPAGTFFDQTFPICLPRESLCESFSQCCSRSCCGSEVDPTRKCRGGCG